MTVKPIRIKAPLIRALLDGRKTFGSFEIASPEEAQRLEAGINAALANTAEGNEMSEREALQRTPEDIVNIVTVLANTKMELPLARWNDIANILLGVSQDIEALIASAETAEQRVTELEAQIAEAGKMLASQREACEAFRKERDDLRARLAAYESAAGRHMKTTGLQQGMQDDLDKGYNPAQTHVQWLLDDIDTLTARLAAETAEKERLQVFETAVLAVIEATRAYLPPDGITKDELINCVLAATDNAQIVAALVADKKEG